MRWRPVASALCADEITHDELQARNGATLRKIREAGGVVEEEVLRILRERS